MLSLVLVVTVVYVVTVGIILWILKRVKFDLTVDREFVKTISFVPAINTMILIFMFIQGIFNLSAKLANKILGE